ncbi:hypothetical protein O9K51_10334 [Purpureocillium lavendulum]|uniref:Uncharacterized protein n=1 Tax=Purpureocillium lavendulum TaxID=1247861 RepID=A0AB34FDN7_9HYPO|nr:hypothetical protein O9K51_10334 [Purpureocillium lavendulum]
MGRPKRTDKEQRETSSSSHNPHKPTRSPTLPTSSHTASAGFTPNSDTCLGHDLDDTVDPALGGVQYLESFDFTLQDATLEDDSLDIPPGHYLNATLDLPLDQSIPAITDERAETYTATANVYSRFPPMRHESIQELSNLNLELYRQLGVVRPMAIKYRIIHPSLVTLPDGNHTLSDAVVFMMHGLQTYHKLLVEILGFTGPAHDALYDSHDHPNPNTTSLLSPADVGDNEDPRVPVSGATGRQRRKILRSDSDAERTVLHDSSHSALLDMPTSLLLLSCHTNLIYLCGDVFAAIRAALLATRRQITLFTFSFLHSDEISIPQDPDLQIIVLTQAVIRLIDRIRGLLSYPDDCDVDPRGKRCETKARRNAIPPQLLDLVLRWEARGGGLADRVGIEALREEIRRLHELVYKPV